MKSLLIISCSLLSLVSLPALSADIAAGKAKTATCVGCHGSNGVAIMPNYPNLKGQGAAYLEKQLHDFKSGKRADPTMKAMTAALSDEDIKNIAAYYASLK